MNQKRATRFDIIWCREPQDLVQYLQNVRRMTLANAMTYIDPSRLDKKTKKKGVGTAQDPTVVDDDDDCSGSCSGSDGGSESGMDLCHE